VLSGSGGLQGEVTAPSIGRAIFVLRTSTERPEAVEAGYARAMGFEKEAIWREMEARAGRGAPSREHPNGTGNAARKIVDVPEDFLEKQALLFSNIAFPFGPALAMYHQSPI